MPHYCAANSERARGHVGKLSSNATRPRLLSLSMLVFAVPVVNGSRAAEERHWGDRAAWRYGGLRVWPHWARRAIVREGDQPMATA